MTQKETYLAALRCENTGKTPLFLRFWHVGGWGDFVPFEWRDQLKRAEWAAAHGITDTLLLQPPMGYIEDYDASKVPGISAEVERAETAGTKYPVLRKVYHTPEGDLRHEVQLTEDWIYGEDVFLFSDFNVSRAVKHAVADMQDARKLRFLLGEPSAEAKSAFRAEAERIRRESGRLGVAVDGGWVALGDALVDLCGMERVLAAQYEEPELLEAVLDALLEWELGRAEAVLDEGCDAIVYMAWYEGCDFWTPSNWRAMLKPRIKRLVDLAHDRGRLFRYIMTKGCKPVLKDLAEMGVDCLTGIDPLQDAPDPAEIRRLAGPGMALMGGLNSSIMLSQWKPAEIAEATCKALDSVRGDPGFILFPVDAVFDDQPWENVETLIKAWEEFQ